MQQPNQKSIACEFILKMLLEKNIEFGESQGKLTKEKLDLIHVGLIMSSSNMFFFDKLSPDMLNCESMD